MLSPNMQNSNESVSPQPTLLPPSPHDPDHVASNDSDSAHDAAGEVGFQAMTWGVVDVFCFSVFAHVNCYSDVPSLLHRRQTT